MTKNPFIVIPNFLSPLEVDNILMSLPVLDPDTDDKGRPLKTIYTLGPATLNIYDKLEKLADTNLFDKHYDTEIAEFADCRVEWYPENCVQEPVNCDNCKAVNARNWKRINSYDFTCVIFLKEYNNKPNFDPEFEVYGGKMEFLNHQFGFTPKIGTAIFFPSCEYFLNSTQSPLAGDMHQIRLFMKSIHPYFYNPNNFKGNFRSWFGS